MGTLDKMTKMFWKVPLLRFENSMLCLLDYKTNKPKMFQQCLPGIRRTIKVSAQLTRDNDHKFQPSPYQTRIQLYRADKKYNISTPALSCFSFRISDSSVICQVRILFLSLWYEI